MNKKCMLSRLTLFLVLGFSVLTMSVLAVGDAAIVDPCASNGCRHQWSTVVDYNIKTDLVGTYSVCTRTYYEWVESICDECGETIYSYDIEISTTQHPTLIYKTEGGITAYHCPKCSYYQY